MKVTTARLPGCLIIEPKVFRDERGFLLEAWQRERYKRHGIGPDFVQSNLSRSECGVLRGLHFQWPNPQGKLVSVQEGEVFDVAVDIRRGSPNFGRWIGVFLSAKNQRQFWIPEGFAHGFVATTEYALFSYHCTAEYDAKTEAAIAWDDVDIGIDWPVDAPSLSEKDAVAPKLKELPFDRLPAYQDTR